MNDRETNMDQQSFESALKRLEEIVHELEHGEVPLDENIKMFQEGIKIAKLCKDKLKNAENEIQKLVKDNEGEFQLSILS